MAAMRWVTHTGIINLDRNLNIDFLPITGRLKCKFFIENRKCIVVFRFRLKRGHHTLDTGAICDEANVWTEHLCRFKGQV